MGEGTSFSIRALRKFNVCGGRARERELPEGDDDTSLDPRDDRRQYHRIRGAGWVPPLSTGAEGLVGASAYHVQDFTQPSPRSGDEGAGEPVRRPRFNPIDEELRQRTREEESARHDAGGATSRAMTSASSGGSEGTTLGAMTSALRVDLEQVVAR